MHFFVRNLIITGLCSATFLLSTTSQANEDFSYPELTVTPSASKRLQMEAAEERENRWQYWAPIGVSAILTLASAATLQNGTIKQDINESDRTDAVNAGYMVGGGWLLTGAILALYYTPYNEGLKSIQKIPAQTTGDKLIRERLAEEHMEKSANLATTLTYLSTISNLAVSARMASIGERETAVMAGLAAIGSITPILFELHWRTVYGNHQKYKKNIYGPVAFTPFFIEPRDNKIYNGFALTVTF
jgi:hypothetical protein